MGSILFQCLISVGLSRDFRTSDLGCLSYYQIQKSLILRPREEKRDLYTQHIHSNVAKFTQNSTLGRVNKDLSFLLVDLHHGLVPSQSVNNCDHTKLDSGSILNYSHAWT
ncbi:hypothetical protein KC19_5G140500 [Ceratodon purpureus]|uniref:Uncharacterized protein n=1 Tax=Ceratodon purpureus TaxID=3225 RepID=A0A8T0I355_CERPU|nr:hypothetical protein KC19_5G140500 [Ceratodon purpureus]